MQKKVIVVKKKPLFQPPKPLMPLLFIIRAAAGRNYCPSEQARYSWRISYGMPDEYSFYPNTENVILQLINPSRGETHPEDEEAKYVKGWALEGRYQAR